MKNPAPVFILLVLTLFITYCTRQVDSAAVQTNVPYFPRLMTHPENGEQMEALLIGELVFEQNCFKIRTESSVASFTPIWPPDFDYQLTQDSVFIILNAAGNEVARTGAGIRLSGGEIRDAKALEGKIEGGVPKLLLTCPVPYWLVGEEIQVVDTESGLSAEVRSQLKNWFDFYTPHIEDWRLNAFSISDRWKIDSLIRVPTDNIYPLADRPETWLHFDPSGRYNLDLYARDVVVNREDSGRPIAYAISPDSEVALEQQDRDMRQRLLFCGTPCRFEDAYWQDDQTVVVAGLHQGEAQRFHPTIWRIKLNELTVRQYTYPTPLPDPFPYNFVQEMIFEGI